MKNLFVLLVALCASLPNLKGQYCEFTPTVMTTGLGGFNLTSCSGDFNNDGKSDLVTMEWAAGFNTFLQTTGNSFNQISSSYTVSPNAVCLSGDFNTDGNLDVVEMNINPFRVYFGAGNGTFTLFPSNQGSNGAFQCISKDFNNDGSLDIAYSNTLTNSINIMLGNNNGTFNSPFLIPTTACFCVNDFNNDGKLDICYVSANVCIATGVGNGTFNTPNCLSSTSGGFFISSNDFNNDAFADVAVANSNTTTVYFGNGASNFPAFSTMSLTSTEGITSADFNNDAKADLAVYRRTTNTRTVSLLFNANTNSLATGVTYTFFASVSNLDGLIPSDFNSDGIMDLAVTTNSGLPQSRILLSNTNCIWPGDANSDGIANNLDVLELGLHYGLTGPARSTISNSWLSYTCAPWSGTVTTGKNLHYSDCNGDGVINQSDTLAIYNNYGLFHNNREFNSTSANPQLNIIPDQAVVIKNTWGTSSIFLGDATSSVNNINGIAFTVNFDKTKIEPDSVYIEYIASFINSNNLHFRKRNFSGGEIYTATTHTNNSNVSGNGKIAILHYKIKPNLVSDSVMAVSLTKATQMDATGSTTTLSVGSGTILAAIAPLGMAEKDMDLSVHLFPNPSHGEFTLYCTKNFNGHVEILDQLGQVVYSKAFNGSKETFNLKLATGLYFYSITSENGMHKKDKLIIE